MSDGKSFPRAANETEVHSGRD